MTVETWRIHHIYDLYMGSTEGRVMYIKTGNILKPTLLDGYGRVSVRGNSMRKQDNFPVHRFIFSCFNNDWDIHSTLQIDHINNNRCDNRLENLQPLTLIENHHKAQPNRNMSARAKCPRVPVIAQNTITNENLLFKFKSICGKYFSCSGGNEYNAITGCNRSKFLTLDGVKWTCRLATDDEIRNMHFTIVSVDPIVNVASKS